jgi:hypothetical protein
MCSPKSQRCLHRHSNSYTKREKPPRPLSGPSTWRACHSTAKEVFQELVRQFDSGGGPDGKVAVPGLNGIIVYYPLRTGQRYPTRPYGPEFYLNMYECIS